MIMKVEVIKTKQILSFLPVKISINDSMYQKVSVDKSIDYETDFSRIKFRLKLWGMKKHLEYNLDNLNGNKFELYFNLDYGKYTILILGFICCIVGIFYNVFSVQALGYLASMLFFLLIIIQSLFNSLHIGIKEIEKDK
jgi:hypothetical protein